MKLLPVLLACLLTPTIQADPAVHLGLNYSFGTGGIGGIGITAKVLTSDNEDNPVGSLGVSYYPMAKNKFGVDLGGGYAFDNVAILAGWDFIQQGVVVSSGWTNTKETTSISPAPAPAPPPSPAT